MGDLEARLAAADLVVRTAAGGVAGTTDAFERVLAGVRGYVSRVSSGAGDERSRLVFPPVVPRQLVVRLRYVESFPQLLGSVHCLGPGEEAYRDLLRALADGSDWSSALSAADVVLAPAACHPLYGHVEGAVVPAGRSLRFDVTGYCYRNEASHEVTRWRSFRMQELVDIGPATAAAAHRQRWLTAAPEALADLGLDARVESASDPFFGPAARMVKARQEGTGAKFEFVVDIDGEPVAVASANFHDDYFVKLFDVRCADGAPAGSACVAFGLERITLALLDRHGTDPDRWPAPVRRRLLDGIGPS